MDPSGTPRHRERTADTEVQKDVGDHYGTAASGKILGPKAMSGTPDQKGHSFTQPLLQTGHGFAGYAESHQELPELMREPRLTLSFNELMDLKPRPLDLFAPSFHVSEDASVLADHESLESQHFLGMSDRSFAELTQLTSEPASKHGDSSLPLEPSIGGDKTSALNLSLLELPTELQADPSGGPLLLGQGAFTEVAQPLQNIVDSLTELSRLMEMRPNALEIFGGEMRPTLMLHEPLDSWTELGVRPRPLDLFGIDLATHSSGVGGEGLAESTIASVEQSLHPAEIGDTAHQSTQSEKGAVVQLILDVVGQTSTAEDETTVEKALVSDVQNADIISSDVVVDEVVASETPIGIDDVDSTPGFISNFATPFGQYADLSELSAESPVTAQAETDFKPLPRLSPVEDGHNKSFFEKIGLFLRHSFVIPHKEEAPTDKRSVQETADTPSSLDTIPEEHSGSVRTTSQHSGMLLQDMSDHSLTPQSYEYSYPRMAYSQFLDALKNEQLRRDSMKSSSLSTGKSVETERSDLSHLGLETPRKEDDFFNVTPDFQKHRSKLHSLFPRSKKQPQSVAENSGKTPDALSDQNTVDATLRVMNDIFSSKSDSDSFQPSMASHMQLETFDAVSADQEPKTPSGHELLDTESVDHLPADTHQDSTRTVHSEPSLASYSATFFERTAVIRVPFGLQLNGTALEENLTLVNVAEPEAAPLDSGAAAYTSDTNDADLQRHLNEFAPSEVPTEVNVMKMSTPFESNSTKLTEDLPAAEEETAVDKVQPSLVIADKSLDESVSPVTELAGISDEVLRTEALEPQLSDRTAESSSAVTEQDMPMMETTLNDHAVSETYQAHTVESAEMFQRIMSVQLNKFSAPSITDFLDDYGNSAFQQETEKTFESEALEDAVELSEIELLDALEEDVHLGSTLGAKKAKASKMNLKSEENQVKTLEFAEEYLREEMYQKMSEWNQKAVKKKSSIFSAIGKLFRRRETGKKEAKTARSSEQDVASSADLLSEKSSADDDLEPLGMSLRSSQGLTSFPDLTMLNRTTNSRMKSQASDQVKDSGAPLLSTSAEYDGDYCDTSTMSTVRDNLQKQNLNFSTEASATDSIQIDRSGIEHMDMAFYEQNQVGLNHSGDSVEPAFWGSMPGGAANLPINMDLIHPYKKVVEYGGRYGPNQSLILLWACHLPSQLTPRYQHVMEHLFRYVATCLDLLAEEKYKVLFFNGAIPNDCEPPKTWLHDIFMLLDNDTKKRTLEQVLIVHSDQWFKSEMKLMDSAAISTRFITEKVQYVANLDELRNILSEDVMEFMTIPENVWEYDAHLSENRH